MIFKKIPVSYAYHYVHITFTLPPETLRHLDGQPLGLFMFGQLNVLDYHNPNDWQDQG
jgi:hypothetical protein